jgi:hypothetical protein
MNTRSGGNGHALAVAGGAGLALSLWMPWYTVDFPQSALNTMAQMSQRLGALGGLIRSGTALLSQLGPFHVTSWQAFKTVPAVLLVIAIIGGGLALLALTDKAGDTSQLTVLASVVGGVLVVYRIAVPPGQGNFVHPAWGIYLALVSSLAMLAGAVLAHRANAEPAAPTPMPYPYVQAPTPDPYPAPTPDPFAGSTAGSLPPPAA